MKKITHIYCRHSSVFEIPFFDVDSMHVMWHGHYVKYLEMARCAFLEEINYTYDVMREKGYAWPIVQLNLKYVRPARFRQKIRVNVNLVDYETCCRMNYMIVDVDTNQKLTEGSTTQMAVDVATLESQFQTPACWRAAVESYPWFCAKEITP